MNSAQKYLIANGLADEVLNKTPPDTYTSDAMIDYCAGVRADRENSIKNAVEVLEDDHVKDNLFRLGALGAGDVKAAISILKNVANI